MCDINYDNKNKRLCIWNNINIIEIQQYKLDEIIELYLQNIDFDNFCKNIDIFTKMYNIQKLKINHTDFIEYHFIYQNFCTLQKNNKSNDDFYMMVAVNFEKILNKFSIFSKLTYLNFINQFYIDELNNYLKFHNDNSFVFWNKFKFLSYIDINTYKFTRPLYTIINDIEKNTQLIKSLQNNLITSKHKILQLQNNIKQIHQKNNFNDVYDISNLYIEIDNFKYKQIKDKTMLDLLTSYKFIKQNMELKRLIQDMVK